jgi:hypothetical protein
LHDNIDLKIELERRGALQLRCAVMRLKARRVNSAKV